MVDFAKIKIVGELPPAGDYTDRACSVFQRLAGATIVNCGSPSDPELVDGGGFVIDYVPHGDKAVRRLVFAFTELGMWIEYDGPKGPT